MLSYYMGDYWTKSAKVGAKLAHRTALWDRISW